MHSKEGRERTTIYRELLNSFIIILIIFLSLFTFFATKIIFTRLDANINTLLDRSLTLAWDEYNDFFRKSTAILSSVTSLTKEPKYNDAAQEHLTDFDENVCKILDKQKDFDFWLVVNNAGQIINSSKGKNAKFPQDMVFLLQDSWQKGLQLTTSEKIPIKKLLAFNPALVEKALVTIKDPGEEQNTTNAIFQITAVPFKNQQGSTLGSVVTGHLLNKNSEIAHNYSTKIPNSFLSVSIGGIRIATNLSTDFQKEYLGSIQTEELIQAIKDGKRYFGQVKLGPTETHIVTSDPIYNLQGKVIGALTVGVPSHGLADLKKDTTFYILMSALICLGIAFAISSFLSKRLSRTVLDMSKTAKEVSQLETINSHQLLKLIDSQQPTKIREIWYLQLCLNKMATSLLEKIEENQRYLKALEEDKAELQRLTTELQETNLTLENKVKERTHELWKAVLELRELNNLKSKFLANMSHEIRTPLNSIIGFSEMLDDELFGELNSTQKEYVQIILNSSQHLLELINNILDLSIIEQGKITLSKQQIDINSTVFSVITIIRPQAENKNLSLQVEIGEDLPFIAADPTRIKQVLYNLLANAVKFTPSGGTIKVKAELENSFIKITVQDTGVGIKPEDQTYIFDEFYQAENSYERKFEGVGLGLPLSKHLVELHNGKIELFSAINEGTTVIVYLPVL